MIPRSTPSSATVVGSVLRLIWAESMVTRRPPGVVRYLTSTPVIQTGAPGGRFTGAKARREKREVRRPPGVQGRFSRKPDGGRAAASPGGAASARTLPIAHCPLPRPASPPPIIEQAKGGSRAYAARGACADRHDGR